MSSVNVGDELLVVVWRASLDDGFPIAAPIGGDDLAGKRIEVIDGEVDSVVRIRVLQRTAESILGKVVGDVDPESEEWDLAQEILTTKYDFQTDVIEQEGRRRLMIRASRDFQNQWLEHKKETLDGLPDHQ